MRVVVAIAMLFLAGPPLAAQNGKNPLAGETGAGHDARPHLMHDRKHLLLVRPRTFLDTVMT